MAGQPAVLRPVQFDTDDYDKEYRKADGQIIRPTMAVTTCPGCGQLVEQEIPLDHDLSQPVPIYCNECNPFIPVPPPPSFPFRDPIAAEAVSLFDINPMALSNISVFLDGDEEPVDDTPVESPLVERRSEGLGQFIRRRDQWKKITKAVDDQLGPEIDTEDSESLDLFEMMGQMSEHYSEPTDDPST